MRAPGTRAAKRLVRNKEFDFALDIHNPTTTKLCPWFVVCESYDDDAGIVHF